MEEDEIGEACSAYGGPDQCVWRRNDIEDLRIDGMVILNRMGVDWINLAENYGK
jgi:hypothetical protein